MNIIKSLHSSLLHKCMSFQERHYFTVSVLWGFDLQTGEPVLEQNLWQAIGNMLGNNELFDTGMPKPNAELLVRGSCFAANGEAVEASRVCVSLGAISKELMVFGDRNWIKSVGVGWGISDPEAFTEMPINYSNAFGGKNYTPNPVGKGLDEIETDVGLIVPVPNIEFGDQLIGSPKDKPRPASLNRIDMLCEQRMSNAGTYDQKYIETRMPGFPDDLDYKYFNDASKDQWINGYFNGDEAYEIRNMNPQHPLIKGNIPGVYGRVFVNQEINDEIEFKEISTKLDTVWFFPTENIGVLIHRGTLDINEDDGADIKQILIANENRKDRPRTAEHYKNELALRINPDEAFKYMLYTSPLIPEDCICAFKSMQENSDFPLEVLTGRNMQSYSDAKAQELDETNHQKIVDVKQQLKNSGLEQKKIDDLVAQISDPKNKSTAPSPEIQKISEIIEKILPGMMSDPKNIDLSKLNLKAMDEFNVCMEDMQEEKKAEAKKKLIDQVETLKNSENKAESLNSISQLEKAIVEMDLPPILPRNDTSSIIDQLKNQRHEMDEQLLKMKSMGVNEEDLAKFKSGLDFDALEKQANLGIEQANESYRISAHYIEKARSPHEGKEDEIRQELLKSYKMGGLTSHGDYAFVDLSNLDLTGIDLSGAYLEYANLTNTNLTDANLSKTILAHANFHNTILVNTNLVEANLGAINFDGAFFSNVDLTNATLSKSNICNTKFERCKMADKVDMFLDTKFEKASFEGSDMRKNTFLDTDIRDCDFTDADLSESSFVNPIMNNVIFSGANLSGVNFVKAIADGSKFDKAILKNVRFVAESSLNHTDFSESDVQQSNLRDCSLINAKFDEANLFKSDFGGANLKKSSFKKVIAIEAQFSKANLEHAVFDQADLFEGSMYKAKLSSASFCNSNLYSVNFLGCTVGNTDFTGADLNQTIFKDWRP